MLYNKGIENKQARNNKYINKELKEWIKKSQNPEN
jgi:hypothetical protein